MKTRKCIQAPVYYGWTDGGDFGEVLMFLVLITWGISIEVDVFNYFPHLLFLWKDTFDFAYAVPCRVAKSLTVNHCNW